MPLFKETSLPDLIKVGEVSSVDPEKCTARVVFDDESSMVSYDLPILQRNTYENHDYQMVHVGEDVLCVFLGTGQEDGFILGAFYAGEIRPPESSVDRRTIVFKDDTKVSYDRSSHTMTVEIEGTSIVANRQKVSVTTPQAVTIDAPQTTLTGNLTVAGLIKGQGGLAISGGSGATVDGALKTTGDVKAGGISLQTHTHKEQGDGAETSTPH